MAKILKSYWVILFLHLPLIVVAQKPVWDLNISNFNFRHNSTIDLTDNFIFTTNFQDSISIDSITYSSSDTSEIIGKVNDCGKLQWTSMLSGKNIQVVDIETDKDLNIYIVIQNKKDELTYKDTDDNITNLTGKGIYLIKLNPNGKFIWSRLIEVSIWYGDGRDIELVIDAGDNLYLYSEYTNSIVVGDSIHTINEAGFSIGCIKFNNNGTVSYIKNILSDLGTGIRPPGIDEISFDKYSNKHLMLIHLQGSSIKAQNDTFKKPNHFLFELDTNSIITNTIFSESYNSSGSFRSCVRLPDGDFIIAGNYSSSNDSTFGNKHTHKGKWDVFMVRITPEKKSVWFKEYGGPKNDYFNDILLNNDADHFYAYFNTESSMQIEGNNFQPDDDGYVLTKFDIDGNNNWVKFGDGAVNRRALERHISINSKDEIYYNDQLKNGSEYQFDCYTKDEQNSFRNMVFLKLADEDTSLFCDISKCPDSEIKITSPLSNKSYQWSTGEQTKSITINKAGTYTLTLNTDVCTYVDSITVTEDNIDVPVSLGKDTFFCEGDNIQLTANTTATKYEWSNSETSKSIQVNQEGEYIIKVTENGCIGRDSIYVSALPYPIVNLGSDTTMCFEDGSYLLNGGIADEYKWSTGEATASIQVTSAGKYSLTATNNGICSTEDEILIEDGCRFTLFVPSVFHPNSLNTDNAIFKPIGNRIIYLKLTITNRWGQILYIGENENAQWDGTYNGSPALVGQYLYIIDYKAKGSQPGDVKEGTKAGTFMLLK